jgi:16S rRNA (uracil1498-N3)-methyltransferase
MGFALVGAMIKRRCPVPKSVLQADALVVTASTPVRYLVRALRLRTGQTVEFFDGSGAARRATLHALSKDRVEGTWTEVLRHEPEDHLAVVVPIIAWLKGSDGDDAVAALSALGVRRLRIFKADREPLGRQLTEDVLARWGRIALDSCRQSGGYWCTQVEGFDGLEAATQGLDALVFGSSQGALMREFEGGTVGVVVGPEGGLSPEEEHVLECQSARPVRLGSRVLRARHAASLLPAAVYALSSAAAS